MKCVFLFQEKEHRMSIKDVRLAKLVELVNESNISSIKSVVSGIIKIINDPKASVKDLIDLIEIDPPLMAKVLKAANCSYYSPRHSIYDIEKAIIWLGFDHLKELALSQKVCEIFGKDESIDGYSRSSLWKHSVAVGLLGKMIYRKEFGERGENIYIGGLLHDFGIITEDQFLSDDFKFILDRSKNENKNLSITEDKVLGYNHSEIGMAIATHWNFPEELIMAIGYHHNPDCVIGEYLKIATTLYLADYLCQEEEIGYGDTPFRDTIFFEKSLKELGLKSNALDLIVKDLKKEITKMEEQGFFG